MPEITCNLCDQPLVPDYCENPLCPGFGLWVYNRSLYTWAAHEAAEVLIDNWQAALADGAKLSDLVEDVDQVIGLLQRWKAAVSELAAESEERAETSKLVAFQGMTCTVEINLYYVSGRPAIQLYDAEDGMPAATATVNLVDVSDEQIRALAEQTGADPQRVTFVKDWGENEGMCDALVPPAPHPRRGAGVAGVVRRLPWTALPVDTPAVEVLVGSCLAEPEHEPDVPDWAEHYPTWTDQMVSEYPEALGDDSIYGYEGR